MSSLNLVSADTKYKEEYLEFIKECRDDIKETGFDYVIPLSSEETVEADIKRLNDYRAGKNLPEGWVPASTYWLMENNRIIGTISIRHRLNVNLKFRGGRAYFILCAAFRERQGLWSQTVIFSTGLLQEPWHEEGTNNLQKG